MAWRVCHYPQVNEVPLRGKNVNEVCDIMAKMQGTLTLLVVPTRQHVASASSSASGGDLLNSSSLSSSSPLQQQHQPVMHVKAHIDYDPEDDLYLPCRELGLSFLKVSAQYQYEYIRRGFLSSCVAVTFDNEDQSNYNAVKTNGLIIPLGCLF